MTTSGNIQINLNSNPLLNSLQIQNNLTIFNNNGVGLWIYGNSSFQSMITSSSKLAMNTTFVLPTTNGISGQILSTDGKGNTSWVNDIAGGTVTSVGLTNTDSNLTITGGPVTTSGNIAVNLNPAVTINTITLNNTNKYGYKLSSPTSLVQNLTLTLPLTNGTAGQVLSTDGKGNTSWGTTASVNSSYLLTQADTNLPNATVLPVINTGTYSSSTAGSGNLYIGTKTGNNNIAPNNNIAIGPQALNTINNNSIFNVAIGPQALTGAINTIGNTVIGYQSMSALGADTTGTYYNTAVGYQTFSNLTGPISLNSPSQYNTALGYMAGYNQSSYKNCTFIGALADASVSGLTNAIAIGYNAKVSQSNSIVLGAVYGTIGSCTVGIGTTAPRYPLHIANSNTSLSLNSAIGLNETSNNPPPPSGANDIAIFAKKGNDYGAMYMINSKGSIYKFDSTNISAPASEPKIPVLTADEIQNLQEIALGAIVYDSTNDTVIISTKSGWQNLTRSLYNPQSVSAEI